MTRQLLAVCQWGTTWSTGVSSWTLTYPLRWRLLGGKQHGPGQEEPERAGSNSTEEVGERRTSHPSGTTALASDCGGSEQHFQWRTETQSIQANTIQSKRLENYMGTLVENTFDDIFSKKSLTHKFSLKALLTEYWFILGTIEH